MPDYTVRSGINMLRAVDELGAGSFTVCIREILI